MNLEIAMRPVTSTVTTTLAVATPEDPAVLRHADLWVVATKSGRDRPWVLVGAIHGETNARVLFDAFRTAGAHCAIVPPVDAGVYAKTNSVMHARARVTYVARPTRAVEVWDDGKHIA